MKIERPVGHECDYVLHDASMSKVELVENRLILSFQDVCHYISKEEQDYLPAQLIFEQVHDVTFFVFQDILSEQFSGACLDVESYQDQYTDATFEVLTETYNWGRAVLEGWLWQQGKPVHCLLTIGFLGEAFYQLINLE